MTDCKSDKAVTAMRWNTMSQITQKLLSPFSNMLVAHILAPEVFGIVTSITMLISFTDIFTEAGFQKYIVQHEIENDEKFEHIVDVAFYTNLVISVCFFFIIVFFRTPITLLIGTPGKETALIVTALVLPMTSFSSIQYSVFQRKLDFKPLFKINFIGAIFPIFITVPLALIGFGYWSIILGKISSSLYLSIALTCKSSWKPGFFYSFKYLKKMMSFCGWSMCESIMVWLSSNGDIFLIMTIMSSYYVGIYKTSMSTVNMLMRLISASILPVTYSVISRLQNNKLEFQKACYETQRTLGAIMIPMGVGIFIYRELFTSLLLGKQWADAQLFIGVWALSSSFVISFHYICDDIYRAIGKPELSFIAHTITFLVTMPTVYIFGKKSFQMLIIARGIVVNVLILVDFLLLKRNTGISMISFFKNNIGSFVASCCMACFCYFCLNYNPGIILQFVSIGIAICLYFFILCLFPNGKKILFNIINLAVPNYKKRHSNQDSKR